PPQVEEVHTDSPFDSQSPTLDRGEPADKAAAGASPHGSLVGTSFGDFELVAEVGRGGMGVVYKARQKSLDRIVALKMLLKDHFRSETVLARFLAEARSAAALAHPNIVTIYQVGESSLGHYFAMEFIDGQALDVLMQKGAIPIPWTVS